MTSPTTTDTRQSIELDVQGMTCASCAARIEKKLNKVPGVAASVNYATEKAHVVAPTGISVEDLIGVVQQAGYDAKLPVPDEPPVDQAARIKGRLIWAAILGVPVIVLAMVPAFQFPGWQWLSLVLAGVVVLWCGRGFHRSAWVNLRHGATTMDTLISLGTLAAYLWSVYCMVFGTAGMIGMRHGFSLRLTRGDALGNVYFEAAAGTIIFILAGRFIEARSRREAGSALHALLELGAKQVTVLKPDATGRDVERVVPIEALKVGDRFLVRPGEKVPSDGVVESGHSAVDASLITGESMPLEVGPGSALVGASMNTTGALVVRATAVGQDTQLAQIARLVELAQTGKSASQRLADRISSVFVPVVIGLALATLVGWLISGAGVSFAITAAVAVLIISCPCALGLATPTALLVGTGRGAQLGIVIRGPEALEQARAIDTVVLDKTGTLTTGVMTLQQVVPAAGVDADELLSVAGALEQNSEHPIARAIQAGAAGRPARQVSNFVNLPGLGVQATVDGAPALAGSRRLLERQELTVPAELRTAGESAANQGASVTYVARDGRVLGMLAVADELAPGSARAVELMRRQGLQPVLLTGDNLRAAEHIARQVGIDQVHAQVLPADKLDVVAGLQRDGHRVAMVGDGVNDAAALTQADLGVAMGGGTDVAIAASDITLMRPDLVLAVDAIRLSRRTLRTIYGNLFWAFFYNVCAIPVAALGFLNPMLAGAAMAFSSVFVVTNSLRLRGFRPTPVRVA